MTSGRNEFEGQDGVPRPRLKRLLRISLRMVFVLTTILCIWLGYKARRDDALFSGAYRNLPNKHESI